MDLLTRAQIIKHMLHFRLTWNRRDIETNPYQENQNKHASNNSLRDNSRRDNIKFTSAKSAAGLIQDNETVIVCGIGGNQRVSNIAWAIRDRFENTNHPANITLIGAPGHGGRGKAPGTLEELAVPGLIGHFICSHFETFNEILHLADQQKLILDCLPLGILSRLVKSGGQGISSMRSTIGKGTFCDPDTGTGSTVRVSGGSHSKRATGLIKSHGDQLEYHLPRIDIAIFNAPAADHFGNIYIEGCSTYCESKEAAEAALYNNGKVIVTVGKIIAPNPEAIFLSADKITAIVYHPGVEQTATVPHQAALDFLTLNHNQDTQSGLETLRLMNRLAGITPKRGNPEQAMAHQAVELIKAQVPRGSLINIGTGLPEQVCESLYNQGELDHELYNYTLFTEAGVIGGVPAPGIFFGAAVTPKKMISSPDVFELAEQRLAATVLGFLQVDSEGNVNASLRGHRGAIDFVGPGGFIDLSCSADTIIFIGSWMAKAKITRKNGVTQIRKRGREKFVNQVDQITFSGPQAMAQGKKVYYVTDVADPARHASDSAREWN
ncbi:MAG: hypothetical protein MI864_23195 [Pseudomonadales bacterium]|nr:hypothetical protein [Pseudomonadales bacterium]